MKYIALSTLSLLMLSSAHVTYSGKDLPDDLNGEVSFPASPSEELSPIKQGDDTDVAKLKNLIETVSLAGKDVVTPHASSTSTSLATSSTDQHLFSVDDKDQIIDEKQHISTAESRSDADIKGHIEKNKLKIRALKAQNKTLKKQLKHSVVKKHKDKTLTPTTVTDQNDVSHNSQSQVTAESVSSAVGSDKEKLLDNPHPIVQDASDGSSTITESTHPNQLVPTSTLSKTLSKPVDHAQQIAPDTSNEKDEIAKVVDSNHTDQAAAAPDNNTEVPSHKKTHSLKNFFGRKNSVHKK